MNKEEIALNLLSDKTCRTCSHYSVYQSRCRLYTLDDFTCEQWEQIDNKNLSQDEIEELLKAISRDD